MACAALALPASGWASSGGSGVSPPAPSSGASANQPASVQSGNASVSATGNGVTLQTNASSILRRGLAFSGTAPTRLAGDTVEIERYGHQTQWRWTSTLATTIQSDGSFAAVWKTNHIGRFAIRAVVASPSLAQSATTTPSLTITIYRPSMATQYGPGFYGHRTACGVRLTKMTVGVANRTLRCGTNVAVYYQGRTMIVPVIDRGPYATGVDWDLTEATGRALGIGGTAKIGAVSLPLR
jgi:hypothetical protein